MSQRETQCEALREAMVRDKHTSQFVGFLLADQEYAFRIDQIQEIVILKQVTRMPQVPDYMEGVSNLRGTIIPIIDLRRLFGLESHQSDKETRTIVVNVGERTMGCTVDSVTQVHRIPDDSIQAAPDMITGKDAGYITGFAKQNNRILVILNIDELLEPEKLDRVQQAVIHNTTMPEL